MSYLVNEINTHIKVYISDFVKNFVAINTIFEFLGTEFEQHLINTVRADFEKIHDFEITPRTSKFQFIKVRKICQGILSKFVYRFGF